MRIYYINGPDIKLVGYPATSYTGYVQSWIPDVWPNIQLNNGYLDKYPTENQSFDLTKCVGRFWYPARYRPDIGYPVNLYLFIENPTKMDYIRFSRIKSVWFADFFFLFFFQIFHCRKLKKKSKSRVTLSPCFPRKSLVTPPLRSSGHFIVLIKGTFITQAPLEIILISQTVSYKQEGGGEEIEI